MTTAIEARPIAVGDRVAYTADFLRKTAAAILGDRRGVIVDTGPGSMVEVAWNDGLTGWAMLSNLRRVER